ncbi:transmembrane protein 125 [Phyllopteryx taeniolatus]|uniref:transmembrane protein 125 n=1 Tax=Phyllopteryx taeniolatus TaxID=161469 RepID=UPI002AD2056A|nr:transmembrane protein 125 [Phyllopteryx taeniolatus]XP_061634700.1 transmembrane protein 125 [Phyllopteryx taeniolatus]XP_061634701.1 transmembrane protein 125 [Phyllopteryx taeniolatus]XP_061634702.1 transmembrane protein 125 [Phyllopteryx taeniolatus]XP_061634703.1 transmembrane protein 125 [Phyllopteryx taeniolatus]
MPELDDIPPLRGPRGPEMGLHGPADPIQIQHGILEEQVELWWFREPGKSLLCYSIAVFLIVGCGLGGVGLLSTTTSVSSEWRLGVGTALCLLALGVLLKQLLSSAVQDMNCIRSRQQIDMLKSGGLSDFLVVLIAGMSMLICGGVLLHLALVNHMPKPGQALNDMYVSGVVLLTGGGAAVLGVGIYSFAVILLERTRPGRRFVDRMLNIFTISGHMDNQARRETTSSLANLI